MRGMIKLKLRSRNGEHTRPACESGPRARTFVITIESLDGQKSLPDEVFGATPKPPAGGGCSPEQARAPRQMTQCLTRL